VCEYCHSNPHLSSCPDAPEPPIVYECSCCGEPIYEGDIYYDINDDVWCEECILDARKEAERETYE
jgi:hypothetical protein